MSQTAKGLFPPVEEAARLYPGKVMHARLMPFGHRFTYRVFSLLIDLDRLADAGRLSNLFSVNRSNLVSFHERDHLGPDAITKTLRAHIDRLLGEAGIDRPSRIQLLCYPRILGYVFNPLSVYYCHAPGGGLSAVVYEVRNTFGEKHTYVCPVMRDDVTAGGLRQERTKIFYVSPFIDMRARYHFRMLPPGKSVRMRILETENGHPLLSATFSGEAADLTTRNLFAQLVSLPFMTLKIMVGIHWEALKLWLEGRKISFARKPAGAGELQRYEKTL